MKRKRRRKAKENGNKKEREINGRKKERNWDYKGNSTDIFDLFVDLGGDVGDAANGGVGELEVDLLRLQQGDLLTTFTATAGRPQKAYRLLAKSCN